MQVGSLVVCVDDNGTSEWAIPLSKGKIYTVREVCDRLGVESILLEEIKNKMFSNGEGAYKAIRFRELDTPISIDVEELIYEKV